MDIWFPYSFLGFDSGIYLAAAIIGFVLAYYAFRTHEITSNKSHFYLYTGFAILSMGLLILSMTSFYTFINYKVLCTTPEACYTAVFDSTLDMRDFGYWLYFISSLVAYSLFAIMYLPRLKQRVPAFCALLWWAVFPYFHLLSFFIISYVIFRSLANYARSRDTNSLLVFLAFLFMGVFHILLLLTPYGKILYVSAHFILLIGFISLLAVLVRINRKKGIFGRG
jgi:hypothetical protein